MKKLQHILLLPDYHVRDKRLRRPIGHDPKALRAVLAYAKTQHWDWVINLGDWMDFLEFKTNSEFHDPDIDRLVEYAEQDYVVANRELDLLLKATPKARHVYIEGNHEYRMKSFLNRNPHIRPLLDLEKSLDLKEREIQYVPFWSENKLVKLGKLLAGHGLYTNEHHAKKHAMTYPGLNFFYAHVHGVQQWSPVTFGDDNTPVAQSCGCLCNYRQPYQKGKPTNWQHAFAEIWMEQKYFHYVVRRLFRRQVVVNGKVYKG